ncbi:AAA family ATPase [bacterium]|nr:AAA family ATPase [bacterium]
MIHSECLTSFVSEKELEPHREHSKIMTGTVKGKQNELRERLDFETLLSDLSAQFVKLEPEEIDREIELALQRLGEFFGVERCGLLMADAEKKLAQVSHAWYAEGIPRVGGETNLQPLFPWTFEKLVMRGETSCVPNIEALPPEAETDRQTWTRMGVRSSLILPLFIGKSVCYLFALGNLSRKIFWPDDYIPRLRLLGETFVNALARKKAEEELRNSIAEIRRLKEKLRAEAEYLRSEINESRTHEEIIGRSAALAKVLAMVEQVAPTDSTVLIMGETGTGKELVARAIHGSSSRADKFLVKVNCASLPSSLVESELFGREKGAYTGALTRQIGRFELADGGTIFLDEISELSLELQAKLLRVLQEGQFERLGSPRTIQLNVRIIAATNRDLVEEMRKGTFRLDLYYRLNVFPIVVPPLRERLDDIPLLVWSFIQEFGEKMGKKITRVARRDMEALQSYSWPGNIRELRNIIEHAVIVSSGDTLRIRLPEEARHETGLTLTLQEMEYQHISHALRLSGGRIKGRDGAARMLGLNPSTLYFRIKKLGITLRDEKDAISS